MKVIFAEARSGIRGWANFFTRLLTFYPFGDKNSEFDSSNFIVERGFLWGYIRKRG